MFWGFLKIYMTLLQDVGLLFGDILLKHQEEITQFLAPVPPPPFSVKSLIL